MNQFNLKVLSLEGKMWEGKAESVTAPAIDGEIQILANHMPFLSPIGIGELLINPGNIVFAIHGGMIESKGNEVSILVETATPVGSISLKAAEIAYAKAQELKEKIRKSEEIVDDKDYARIAAEIARATAELKVAKKRGL